MPTTEESKPPVTVIVCYSRCLYCGRRTPHEVCHDHSEKINPGWLPPKGGYDALYGTGVDQPDEVCIDVNCPCWEGDEADNLRPWWKAWKAGEDDLVALLHERWMYRMRARGFANHSFKVFDGDGKNTRANNVCNFMEPWGRCTVPLGRHHAHMRPWADLTPRTQVERKPGGLSKVFEAGYNAAAACDPILKEVREERTHQDAKYGGPEHDDSYTSEQWLMLMAERINTARVSGRTTHQTIVQLVALGFAALEAEQRAIVALQVAAATRLEQSNEPAADR